VRRFIRGARWADELTDETIDRVARRLAGGETIRAADIGRYFLGVARNVGSKPATRAAARSELSMNNLPTDRRALGACGVGPGGAFRLPERCLSELGPRAVSPC
jgi:hypothetical protein